MLPTFSGLKDFEMQFIWERELPIFQGFEKIIVCLLVLWFAGKNLKPGKDGGKTYFRFLAEHTGILPFLKERFAESHQARVSGDAPDFSE